MPHSARSGVQRNILFLTARQSPEPELLDDLTDGLGPEVAVSEAGLLDGLSVRELDNLRANRGHAAIAAPLDNGAIIELSQKKFLRLAQDVIARNAQGFYDLIVLTSTGIWYEAETRCHVITAQRAVEAAIAAVAMPNDSIGVVVPLARQSHEIMLPGFRTQMTHARHGDVDGLRRAAGVLAGCDYILLNALSYDEEDRQLMAKLTGRPVFLPRRIIATAINLVLGAPVSRPLRANAMQQKMKNLTPRERQVMAIVCKGLSNKEIAQQLGISHKTVEIHRTNILRKMNARSSGLLISEMAGFPEIVRRHLPNTEPD